MPASHPPLDRALQRILEGTASETGSAFFAALVRNLALVLDTAGAWVTEYLPAEQRLRALAFWMDDAYVPHYEYDIAGTPCEHVIDESRLLLVPDRVVELYPGDPDLRPMNAVSYMGVPLLDPTGGTLGHLAVLDHNPMQETPQLLALFRIFAARAAAELSRIRAEEEVAEREARLNGLFSSAMDAILELDDGLVITRANPAAETLLKAPSGSLPGHDFRDVLAPDCRATFTTLVDTLRGAAGDSDAIWVPGGLQGVACDGGTFPAEATLGRFTLRNTAYVTVIMRNIDAKITAEERIRSLSAETAYLRDEIRSLRGFEEVVGASAAMEGVLHDVERVAETGATVLIHGETGTGKELIARAVHNASLRRERPLIKVNCAAIPATLIESEFFGHEKGAFTGATGRREGRFALADGGTIFLDEIGELPLELQSKLLRVLQEGEFEPVGSSRTMTVDVRLVAATNRNLQAEVEAGRFREDLFYRLNVFPITVPPLRERDDDALLLADFFLKRCSERMGRRNLTLPPDAAAILRGYRWPGNVRELQNVIERAVILATGGTLPLRQAMPTGALPQSEETVSAPAGDDNRILSATEMNELERANLRRALDASGWKVSGSDGAAARLGLPPSTLTSRMKALGIRRPERETGS